jgi:cell division protein FtsB
MRRNHRLPLVLLGSLALAVYFAHHAVNGSHGFQARQRLIERSRVLERDIGRLEAVRDRLRRDVALLAPEQPDPDLVAIIAADMLGYVAADAVVVVPRTR